MLSSRWLYLLATLTDALTFNQSSAPLDFSALGRVAFTGTFNALSVYNYQQSLVSTTGSDGRYQGAQSVRAQLPDGTFATLLSSDAVIEKMCVFTLRNGMVVGTVVAGNFTSIGGINSRSVAMLQKPMEGDVITAMDGIQGQITTLLCAQDTETVYVAGVFEAGVSSNAIAWTATGSWANLPFGGVNGPINSIERSPTGQILFGGYFDSPWNNTRNESSKGLNGLLGYDPDSVVFENTLTNVSDTLDIGATINEILTVGEDIYVAGNFSGSQSQNIFVIEKSVLTKPLPAGGLNGPVTCILQSDTDMLIVGGSFTNTYDNSTPGMNNLAGYNISDQTWHALGAGVDGSVSSLNFLSLNVTFNEPEIIVVVNGNFRHLLAFDENEAVAVDSIGVWVPSRQDWLQNLDVLNKPEFDGELMASVEVPGTGVRLFAGTISSWILSATGVITLKSQSHGTLILDSLGLEVDTHSSQNATDEVLVGLFYNAFGSLNITVVGGNFTANSSDGTVIHNIAFINGSNNDHISSAPNFPVDAKVKSLRTLDYILFVGGSFRDTILGQEVNGLVLFDLLRSSYADVQAPTLGGESVSVEVISTRPGTHNVYVGGKFSSAGNNDCPTVCIFDTSASMWTRPGSQLGGIASFMAWTSPDTMVVAGNLTIDDRPFSLVTYYTPSNQWVPFNEIHSLDGTVTALTQSKSKSSGTTFDSTGFFVSGQYSNGSCFLTLWDGNNWHSLDAFVEPASRIEDLLVMPTTEKGASNRYLAQGQTLLIVGYIELPNNMGNASAAFFDGTAFVPMITTKSASGKPGMLSSIFSTMQDNLISDSTIDVAGIGIAAGVIATLILIIIIGELEALWRRRQATPIGNNSLAVQQVLTEDNDLPNNELDILLPNSPQVPVVPRHLRRKPVKRHGYELVQPDAPQVQD